jgi:L-fuculose-phosphate aldolase
MLIREQSLREEVVRVNRIVAEAGLIRSSDGNISVRLDEERFLITPSGIYKLAMQPEDLIVVDREGRALTAVRGLRPTSEILMHLEAYRQRPDIQAVLHAHPPYATAITIAGLPFPVDLMPEVLLGLGDVPTAPYGTPGTLDLAASIREPIRTCDNVLLSHHGSISVGRTLEEALIALERLEHAAYTYYLARTLGAPIPLPAQEVELLREKGRRLRA